MGAEGKASVLTLPVTTGQTDPDEHRGVLSLAVMGDGTHLFRLTTRAGPASQGQTTDVLISEMGWIEE